MLVHSHKKTKKIYQIKEISFYNFCLYKMSLARNSSEFGPLIYISLFHIPRKNYFVSCATVNLCLNIVVLRQAGGHKKAGAGDSETK